MYQVRFHGRGGQGVVTAAELLSLAAFAEGHHAQAFPSFGSERTGAPVAAFCRIDDHPIRLREPIQEPDALVIQDPTLVPLPGVLTGLRDDGVVIVNTERDFEEVGLDRYPPTRVATVPASRLALEHLGRPVPNAGLLGGFAAMTHLVSLDSVVAAIRERFPAAVAVGNVTCATVAYEAVRAQQWSAARA